jgi:hypothetical protein
MRKILMLICESLHQVRHCRSLFCSGHDMNVLQRVLRLPDLRVGVLRKTAREAVEVPREGRLRGL